MTISKKPNIGPATGAAGKKEDAGKQPKNADVKRSEGIEKKGTGPNEGMNKV